MNVNMRGKKILSKKDLRFHSEFTRLNYILNHALIILIIHL